MRNRIYILETEGLEFAEVKESRPPKRTIFPNVNTSYLQKMESFEFADTSDTHLDFDKKSTFFEIDYN